MELYFVMTICDREKSARVNELYKSFGLNLSMYMLARGTASDEHLSLHGLTATEKAVICTACDADTVKQLIKAGKHKLYIDIPGNGIMLSIPFKSIGGGKTLAYLTDNKIPESEGKPKNEFSHELIMVILNEGYADNVMDIARAAGAGGGTVLHANGTGSKSSEKFLGVQISAEKDIVYIVASAEQKNAIMKAVIDNAGPGTKPGAICFSLPISSVAGLRRIDED